MPRSNQPKQRRITPDKAPWDQLPVIVFHPDPDAPDPEPLDFDDLGDWFDNWERTRDHDQNYDPEHLDPTADLRHGTLAVTRGTFDTATLPARCLQQMEDHPGEEFVVETDGLGRIDVARVGALTNAHLADIGPENTGYLQPLRLPAHDLGDGTLTGYARALRAHGARALELAEEYDQLAADGWTLTNPGPGEWMPPLRRTTTTGEV